MTFWSSSEIYKDIRKQLRPPSLLVENEIKDRVEQLPLKTKAVKWAVIYMIAPEPFLGIYPEVVRYSSRRTVLEFRLIVDYESFKQATEHGRITLLLKCLRRSIEFMKQLKIEDSDREQLLNMVNDVESKFGEVRRA